MKPEKQLYQWDVNQYLTGINPAAQFVDYPIGDEVIRIKADGTRCRIPDEVLQTYGGKTCYERYPDGTYRAYSFTVLYAPKPPDYVFTPEERTTFEALTDRVDAAIDEIKRRADSGEFTPKKGVDYFTDAEKNEMMESVSDGAIGEFRKVVDSATTEYNANASEKMTTYDTNAEQLTTDYNRNAEQKLESYNQNHAEKVAEYNQNAETKTAEFDANAASLQEQMAKKANVDGYYEEMTVGDAEQLVATQFVEDNGPYLFRPTGGSSDVGNRAYLDKIVGGTVAWNQMVEQREYPLTTHGVTSTYNTDGTVTLSGIVTSSYAETYNPIRLAANHVYFYSNVILANPNNISFILQPLNILIRSPVVKNTSNLSYTNYGISMVTSGTDLTGIKFKANFFDLTQMFGSTIADYIYSLEQSQAGAGVAWFKKLFPKDYYLYNAGELLSVEGLQSHDTVGFNQWDEEWEVGAISGGSPVAFSSSIRSKNFCDCLPSTTYYGKCGDYTNMYYMAIWWYDENKQYISYSWGCGTVVTSPSNARYFKLSTNISTYVYGNTYNHDICINLSNPTRNGEYEPYEKHSYPLDSSLILRGIPKLDASNNLYYDGDEYTSDGKVKRKYGVVDLGTLDWEQGGGNNRTSWVPVSWRTNIKPVETASDKANILCNKYYTDTSGHVEAQVNDKTIAVNKGSWVYIYDSAYISATPQEFKAAMSGVMLVYELATPTTETAEPFQNIQVVDDFGTEEFVSNGFIPAGHVTRYPANLRDKLQHLPDLASMDGTYLIQQSDKQMSLVYMPAVFPETPTEDGTYTLKTVVTGGVATLQWVVE